MLRTPLACGPSKSLTILMIQQASPRHDSDAIFISSVSRGFRHVTLTIAGRPLAADNHSTNNKEGPL